MCGERADAAHWRGLSSYFQWLLIMTMITIAPAAFAQAGRAMDFDIPAQPLGSALKAYGEITDIELFYESNLTVDRHAAPVHGRMTPPEALRLLLEGTGLSTTSIEPGTVTIFAPSQGARNALNAVKSKTHAFMPYLASVQEDLRGAFCKVPALRLDNSDVLLRLWIAPSGAVAQAELIAASEAGVRERLYIETVRKLMLTPPPPAMPQPVTLMILPRRNLEGAECLRVDLRQ